MRLQDSPPQHWQWLVDRVGCVITADFRAIEAVDAYEHIHGMTGYYSWTENSCFMHVAVDSPMVLRHMDEAFAYPFAQGGRGVVLAQVKANNAKSIKLLNHIGFTELHRIKDGYSVGVDMILYGMRKEVWAARQKRKAA